MAKIRILPPAIVNRIAAGEVVERPASVLKELVENAIDAAATRIFVDLEEGGARLLRVRDNGSGIPPEELPLAFESHATSKLTEADLDANSLGAQSLGFRGEALASIASVGMVEMISKTHTAAHAHRFRPASASAPALLEPAAGENGTTIEVRNLFHNVPARRKFLKTASTELSHTVAQLTRLALGFPGLYFRLTHGGKPVLELPAVDGLRERLRQLLEKEVAMRLLEVRQEAVGREAPAVTGFIGGPRDHRKDAQGQHFFINGRWVRDRMLAHALRSGYQGFLIPGYQPIAYLFLELPAGEVDVNVHPTKTEVRFRDSSEIYRLVRHAVREALDRSREQEQGQPTNDDSRHRTEQAALDFFAADPRPEGDRRAPVAASPRPQYSILDAPVAASTMVAVQTRPALQVLQSYLLLEDEDGITLIDQHAFHEKILFEEIRRALAAHETESQRLLVPDVIDLPAELVPLVEPAAEVLRPLGFELAVFGPRAAAVHAIPAIVDRGPGRANAASLVRAVLDAMSEEGGEARSRRPVEERLHRIAATIACKRAVKAGTPLSPSEIEYLLQRGELAQDPRHCPHGRPTTVFYSRRDIEREFDRK